MESLYVALLGTVLVSVLGVWDFILHFLSFLFQGTNVSHFSKTYCGSKEKKFQNYQDRLLYTPSLLTFNIWNSSLPEKKALLQSLDPNSLKRISSNY